MLNGKEKRIAMYEKYAARRDELGLTDYRVAQITGLARSLFSEWKKGKSMPKADKRMIIAKAIKKNVTYLFTE